MKRAALMGTLLAALVIGPAKPQTNETCALIPAGTLSQAQIAEATKLIEDVKLAREAVSTVKSWSTKTLDRSDRDVYVRSYGGGDPVILGRGSELREPILALVRKRIVTTICRLRAMGVEVAAP